MLNLERFVTECRAALSEPAPELAIKEILQRIVASPSDVQAALGTPRQGEILPLYHDRDLTILNVIWTPGMAIYPHDHRMWALIGLYGGREDNTFYRRSPQGLQAAGGKQLEVGTPRCSDRRSSTRWRTRFACSPPRSTSTGATSSARRGAIGTRRPCRNGRSTSPAEERSSTTPTSGGAPNARERPPRDPSGRMSSTRP